jgi:hypothetical protein
MKKQLHLIAAILLAVNTHAQTLEWVKQMGGTSSENGRSISVDASGNVYTTGAFNGTCDFDPSATVFNLTPAGSSDVFISKFDASGNFIWAKQIGGTGDDSGESISVDPSGNVYTTGLFSGTVDFDPGPATFNLTSVGSYDIFVSKIDASGNFVWAKQMGGTNIDYGTSIAVDASGNSYLTGMFIGTADFDPGVGTFNLISSGGTDVFVCKLDASGDFVWANKMGGNNADQGLSITIDASNNVYTTGTFNGTSDFDPGAGVFNLTSAGSTDIFISKLDASGNFVWAKQMGGTTNDAGKSIAVDASGNVYTTGQFSGIADFDPEAGVFNLTSVGLSDIFISKIDASGNFVWAKQIGGASNDSGNSIFVDISGNVFSTGTFLGTADFDPGVGVFDLTSEGNSDIFISKLDPSGNFVWAQKIGGTDNDNATSIKVDGSDNIYTTGHFFGTADFDPEAGVFNLTSAGGGDIFVHKMSQTACVVNIPDANFKTYLLGNSFINTNGDLEIQCSEALAFTGMIYCPDLNISDLTGIEAFTSLNSLHCFNNQITTIDLSNNSLIAGIICFNNTISSLNISSNNLLDNIDCSNNPLTSIDLTNKPNLMFLTCSGNQFTSLDLSNKPDLEYLNCQNNQLTSLDLSDNPNLMEVYVGQNQITSLDLSSLQNMSSFSSYNNDLTFLNVKNGNNVNFTFFDAYGNPNLTCIEVDDAPWSTTNWTSIDATASFSENCATSSIEANNSSSNGIYIYPNPAQDVFTISELPIGSELSVLDITGKIMFSTIVNSNQLTINTEDFTNGLYLIHLNRSGTTSTKKLIVNK